MEPGENAAAEAWVTCRSGCRGGSVENDSKPAGIGVVLVAGDEQVLRTGGLEGDQQPRFVAAHAQAVRYVLGERGVRAGLDLDPLVADEGGDRSVEDVEGLVLARVDVDRRLVAGA